MLQKVKIALDNPAFVRQKVVKQIQQFRQQKHEDHFLICFPKCGKIWIRALIGRYYQLLLNRHQDNILQWFRLSTPWLAHPDLPRFYLLHGDQPHWKVPEEILWEPRYNGKKILFLVRDPRDVIVSQYHYRSKRIIDGYQDYLQLQDRTFYRKVYKGTLQEFVYEDMGSTRSLMKFYKVWVENQQKTTEFMLMRYEDLMANPTEQAIKILRFLGEPEVREDLVEAAVLFSSFENLQRLELYNYFNHYEMHPANPTDPDSYRMRRGKIGGYKDELQPAEIQYIEQAMQSLPPELGYHVA